MATITHTFTDLGAKLRVRQATLGDGRDVRSQSEHAIYRTTHNAFQHTISALMNESALNSLLESACQ